MIEVSWLIPVEAVRAMTAPGGTEILTRIEMRPGVRMDPHAKMILTDAGFAACVAYEEPMYPGLKQHAAIQLAVAPQENRFQDIRMEGHRT